MNVVTRVMTWNSERYEMIYDDDLTKKLLIEETVEGMLATDKVEILDSVGDLLFVAVGALWKGGYITGSMQIVNNYTPEEAITLLCYAIRTSNTSIIYSMIRENVFRFPREGIEYALAAFEHAFKAHRALKISSSPLDVLQVICKSNETKYVPDDKVDSNIKANFVKGVNFVPPTEDLDKILKGYIIQADDSFIYPDDVIYKESSLLID